MFIRWEVDGNADFNKGPLCAAGVGSILKLTEGPLAPVACLEDGENTCSRAAQCKTLPIWMGLDELMQNYLESITLADLLEQPEQNRGNSEA